MRKGTAAHRGLPTGSSSLTSDQREHCLAQRLTAQPQEMFGATRLRFAEGGRNPRKRNSPSRIVTPRHRNRSCQRNHWVVR